MVFLALPFKETEKVDFRPPLSKFIKDEYEMNADDYAASFNELNTIRDACVARHPELHESGTRAVHRCVCVCGVCVCVCVCVCYIAAISCFLSYY